MTVPNKPFWLSQANSEFGGNGWASNIISRAGLSVPRWVGELAGRSASITMNLTIGMHNQDVGFSAGVIAYGNLSPRANAIVGGDILAINTGAFINQSLSFALVSGGAIKPFTLTIPGVISRTYTRESADIPGMLWMAMDIQAWLKARNGQTIQLVFTAA
ncbi:hypothetical protein [Aeromonas dhakensis]|uniref:hypothetical protein n=1 Tax=Aeromonas dhakensis TaxID=196024 RepID=UPI001F612084|nr:hypothetical protein [Aeromonas dhakensis]UNU87616.1 hypothetical protein GB930_05130 [Aeromonas dhakensis]